MSTKKTPNIGDKIEHTCRFNGTFEGKVIELLSSQFLYETEKGETRFCLFREPWRMLR